MESAEGDVLFTTEEDALDKIKAARQHQDRTLEMLEDCRLQEILQLPRSS